MSSSMYVMLASHLAGAVAYLILMSEFSSLRRQGHETRRYACVNTTPVIRLFIHDTGVCVGADSLCCEQLAAGTNLNMPPAIPPIYFSAEFQDGEFFAWK